MSTPTPPAATKAELTRLRRQLTRDVPRKTDRNLLVATWNIREFGGLTASRRPIPLADPVLVRFLEDLCVAFLVVRGRHEQ
jgi:hypothetical protein